MPSFQPKIFYRYQALDTRTIEQLCEDKLHFANPIEFNDPLECNPHLECDSDKSTLQQILSELVKKRTASEATASLGNAQIPREMAQTYANKLGEQTARNTLERLAYYATDPDHGCSQEEAEIWLLTTEIQQELRNRHDKGACCFSAKPDCPLLWSHYADQHKGVCIGYGIKRASNYKLRPVEYASTRTIKTSLVEQAILEKNQESLERLEQAILFRKAPQWKYEKEWRIIGDKGLHPSALQLKKIIFGLRCSGTLMYTLIQALKRSPGSEALAYSKIREESRTFKLISEPVDIAELEHFFYTPAIEVSPPPGYLQSE